MELELKNPDEIRLPDRLASSGLTLAEIGAVTCLACLQNGAADDAEIFESEEMKAAMKSLMERKVFKPAFVNGHINITVDLTAVGI